MKGGGDSPSGRCKPPKRKMQTTRAEGANHPSGRCKPPKRNVQTTQAKNANHQAGDANHPSGEGKPPKQKMQTTKAEDSEITTFPFHVFWKILIPYSRCSQNNATDLHEFRCPSFRTAIESSDFHNCEICKNNSFQKWFGIFLVF